MNTNHSAFTERALNSHLTPVRFDDTPADRQLQAIAARGGRARSIDRKELF